MAILIDFAYTCDHSPDYPTRKPQQQTSVWRICLVTKQWKNIFTLHELRHYQTIGYKDQDIGADPSYLHVRCGR